MDGTATKAATLQAQSSSQKANTSFPVHCGRCGALTDRTVTVMLHRDEIPYHSLQQFTFENIYWVETRGVWGKDAPNQSRGATPHIRYDTLVQSKNTSICPACQPLCPWRKRDRALAFE